MSELCSSTLFGGPPRRLRSGQLCRRNDPSSLVKMRRFQRIRTAASTGICSSSLSTAPIRTSAAVISTPSTTTQHVVATSRPLWRAQQPRCFSTTVTRASELEQTEFEETEYEGAPVVETDLVYPAEIVEAVPAEDITDVNYKPAENGLELEEVGGLSNWWEDPEHWGNSKNYVGFGPTEKVTDSVLLEFVVRRAVVEALALKNHAGSNKKVRDALLRSITGPAKLSELAGAEIVADADGNATLKDSEQVWTLWRNGKKDGEFTEGVGATVEEASALVESWGKEWKKIQLRDPVVKFFVSTRVETARHLVTN